MKYWREVLLAILAPCVLGAGAAAINVRDRVALLEVAIPEQQKLLVWRLDQLQAALERIDRKLP